MYLSHNQNVYRSILPDREQAPHDDVTLVSI